MIWETNFEGTAHGDFQAMDGSKDVEAGHHGRAKNKRTCFCWKISTVLVQWAVGWLLVSE